MKRTLIFILTALLLLAVTAPALATSAKLAESTGSITAVDTASGQITVKLADGSELVFNTDSDTVLLSAFDGSALKLGDLAAGMVFQAFHSTATTRSLPPQSYLHTLIAAKSNEDDFAHDYTVKTVTVNNGKTDLLNKEGDIILHLSADTDIRILAEHGLTKAKASDIKSGSRIIAWYQVMAMSYPGQAGPSKVLILSTGSGSSANLPKTGGPVNDTLTICAIVLGLACLAAWVVNNREKN
ncbi:MAG: hypothetical protein VB051_07355 [Candidatus Pelethousia sp.]|nr:hypothetical protein [Candidatus Pelethousia sp.]